ncbi:hypothetical protein WMF27_25995 [Sorangium sp. So ce281]|uniref:hypothetical protein n=1 Tax=unclassified Sorangium TaxID=2621164 RepID=UPI003F5D5669
MPAPSSISVAVSVTACREPPRATSTLPSTPGDRPVTSVVTVPVPSLVKVMSAVAMSWASPLAASKQ